MFVFFGYLRQKKEDHFILPITLGKENPLGRTYLYPLIDAGLELSPYLLTLETRSGCAILDLFSLYGLKRLELNTINGMRGLLDIDWVAASSGFLRSKLMNLVFLVPALHSLKVF